ncbi:MAG: CBS domain-containing protein [Nanoarchaeota archaeon]|nr:CBS domain-containing protein [Nanoarchaeota archaeon]MBU4299815.1 CBS domain-containing protein [Nanoarchaeota archaeon]MBU4451284.1 CBS domain-containing protein [Nanoarchaeota archaeon]MCG2723573.1 CBS domain-containing protein [archaeon]
MKKSINELTARDVMSSEIISVNINDTLKTVLPILINKKIHNVPVFDEKTFVGFFGYKQLARLYRRPIIQTQIGKYIVKPPEITPETSIIDISDYMYRLNQKVLPVVENGKLVGIVSEKDVLKSAIESGVLKGKKVEDFMTPEPLSVAETDMLGTAFSMIRESNISRLPVVNRDGKLVGILKSFDLMKEIFSKEENRGKGDINRGTRAKDNSNAAYVYAPEIMTEGKMPVKALMNDKPATAIIGDPIEFAFKDALVRDIISVVIIDNNSMPIGIVVPKDIVAHLAKQKKVDTINIQISGLDDENGINTFEKDQIHRMINEAVHKLSAIEKIQLFTIHYKSYHTDNPKNQKHSIRIKVNTDNGLFVVRDYGRDIIDVTSKLLESLEDMVISKKQKIKTKIMEKHRYGKWMKNEFAA